MACVIELAPLRGVLCVCPRCIPFSWLLRYGYTQIDLSANFVVIASAFLFGLLFRPFCRTIAL